MSVFRSRSCKATLDASVSSYTSLKDVRNRDASPSQSFRGHRKDSDLSACASLASSSMLGSTVADGLGPLLEGWVLKRSKRVHVWRPRWASLWSGSRESLDFSEKACDYDSTTESFSLQSIRSVKAVPDAHYGRPNCLVVEYTKSSTINEVKCRLVGIQLPSSSERDRWLVTIQRAAAASIAGYGLPENLMCYGQARKGFGDKAALSDKCSTTGTFSSSGTFETIDECIGSVQDSPRAKATTL